MMRARDDEGSTLLLTIFFGVLAVALIIVTAAASTLYLERKRLMTLADGAALAAAEAWELDDATIVDGRLELQLDVEDMTAAAQNYLAVAPNGLTEVALIGVDSSDGRSATVTLRSTWHTPLSSEFVPLAVPIEVTVTARSVFH